MLQKFKAYLKLWWVEILINEYDSTVQSLIKLEKERTLGVYKYMHKPAKLKAYRIKMQGKADKLKQRLAGVSMRLAKLGVVYG
ncbi:hypothetical protein [Aeromonas phage Aer_P220]|uniref:Uncharacterized protein n=1 Tax=Aeromonas phage Aer_P220 TaxID=2951227 RepID=A0A9E7NNG3_9CAUD|nr:hypothetical protein [Aeromonas phage Aer_P220]